MSRRSRLAPDYSFWVYFLSQNWQIWCHLQHEFLKKINPFPSRVWLGKERKWRRPVITGGVTRPGGCLPLPLTSFGVQVTWWVASGHRRKSLIQGKEPEGRDGQRHKGKGRKRETANRTNCRANGEIHVPRWPRMGDPTSWPWTSLFSGNRLGVWTTDSPEANPSARKGGALGPPAWAWRTGQRHTDQAAEVELDLKERSGVFSSTRSPPPAGW